jgi:hypothetical protein
MLLSFWSFSNHQTITLKTKKAIRWKIGTDTTKKGGARKTRSDAASNYHQQTEWRPEPAEEETTIAGPGDIYG